MLMFREFFSAFALMLALLVPSWPAAAQPAVAPPATPGRAAADTPRAEPVAPGTWMVQGLSALGSAANRNFISNAGFVVTPAGVVVIDALGSPELARELRAEIARVTPLPVTHVIVTHYHADHIYGLQTFKDEGATIVAHRQALLYLHSDTARQRLQASREELFPWIDERTRLVPADLWLDGPTTLRVGGLVFDIRPVGPSHTPEDLVVWVPGPRVLFAGDLVFRGRIPFVGQADSAHWVEALDTLVGFDAAVIVPGHGPVSASARADLELTRDYLVHLRRSMGEAAREMEPFDEAYARTDWSRFEKLPLFGVANRMNAYNTYLLMEREAK
jgi:glyoxylase-like metal-dependent hydrolase (beta-lactamase superfamily II)